MDGLDGNWVDGVDPSETPHTLDPSRFGPRDEYELEADDDIRAPAQAVPLGPGAPSGPAEISAADDIPDDNGEFETFRKQLVDHFYYLKHHTREGVTWKCPPAPLLDDLIEPRFIAK